MPFNPDEFLEVARFVHANAVHHRDGFIRSGISRAYYFAHLKSRETLIGKSRLPRGSRVGHGKLVTMFRTSPKSNERLIASMLQSLRNSRENADYNVKSRITINDLEASIRLAENLDTELSKI